jgi:hypothetical protein
MVHQWLHSQESCLVDDETIYIHPQNLLPAAVKWKVRAFIVPPAGFGLPYWSDEIPIDKKTGFYAYTPEEIGHHTIVAVGFQGKRFFHYSIPTVKAMKE